MNAILKQSISQAIRENFTAYPGSYPLNEGDVSEDAADQVINWARNEFRESTEKDKGTESEWLDICVDQYISFFELDYSTTKEYFNYLLS